MNSLKRLTIWSCGALIPAVVMLLLTGCETSKEPTQTKTTTTTTVVTPTKPAPAETASAAAQSKPAAKIIRVDAGSDTNYVDAAGNVWLADTGFADGETVTRDQDLSITNAQNPDLYRTEHYDMTSFSEAVPNGKYTVKLHFAETYEGIGGPGDRVFSFNVGGQHEFKDFDVWVKAGGPQTAYVVTVPDVDVTDGKLAVTFTPDVQSPEINAIEIIPEQ